MPELKPADEQDLLLEHGEVYVAEGRWGKAYFRPPQEPEYSRFVLPPPVRGRTSTRRRRLWSWTVS